MEKCPFWRVVAHYTETNPTNLSQQNVARPAPEAIYQDLGDFNGAEPGDVGAAAPVLQPPRMRSRPTTPTNSSEPPSDLEETFKKVLPDNEFHKM